MICERVDPKRNKVANTTTSETGLPGKKRWPNLSKRNTMAPKRNTVRLASGRLLPNSNTRIKKLLPLGSIENSLGNWVEMMVSAAPALKPNRMFSLTKLIKELKFRK